MIRIDNPYDGFISGTWIKGNLHAHTTHSDGARSRQAVVDSYAALGYDFLSVSDHDVLTDATVCTALDSRGLVLIPGNEITANGPHMLHVGASRQVAPSPDRQSVLDEIQASGGFAIVNHPNWLSDYNHCPFDLLTQWQGYAGIEIFNGVIHRLEGSPYATDKWDRILSTGRRVWGFANDDSHADSGDDALGWNVAYVSERTPQGIVDALRSGRFYASTGVEITDISVNSGRIAVRTANAERVAAIIHDGVRIEYADGTDIDIAVPAEARYVRFECWGARDSQAWTQPFFLTQV